MRGRRVASAMLATVLPSVLAASLLAPVRASAAPVGEMTPAARTESFAHLADRAYLQIKKNKALEQRRRALALLDRVNSARSHSRSCGGTYYSAVKPLRYDLSLALAARRHARSMGTYRYFSHAGRAGHGSPSSRAHDAGYHGGAGENIAAGYPSVAAAMRAWLASPGHCANIMSPQYRHLGIGYADVAGSPFRTYWVQDFGTR